MKKYLSFIIYHLSFSVCVILLLAGCSKKQDVKTSGFVERKDASFVLDGKEYRYVGTNFWYGAILAVATVQDCCANWTNSTSWDLTTCAFLLEATACEV